MRKSVNHHFFRCRIKSLKIKIRLTEQAQRAQVTRRLDVSYLSFVDRQKENRVTMADRVSETRRPLKLN